MEKYKITMFIDYSIKMHNEQKILLWAKSWYSVPLCIKEVAKYSCNKTS